MGQLVQSELKIFFSKNRARIHQVTDRDRDRVLPDPCFPRRFELSGPDQISDCTASEGTSQLLV